MGSRGGPALKALPRTASGRLSRSTDRRRIEEGHARRDLQGSLDARARVYGLKPGEARSQRAGTVEGRMSLAGKITDRQASAAGMYRRAVDRFGRSIGAPRAPGETIGKQVSSTKGCPPPPSGAAEALARRAYEDANMALLKAGMAAAGAVNLLVRHEVEPPARALPDLERGLDALAGHFHIERETVDNRKAVG